MAAAKVTIYLRPEDAVRARELAESAGVPFTTWCRDAVVAVARSGRQVRRVDEVELVDGDE